MITVIQGDNLQILKGFSSEEFSLVYIDPPFGLGKTFTSHNGTFTDMLTGDTFLKWIEPRIQEAHRVLKADGSFFIHMDYREIHYVKVLCDRIFGRENFQNEIIWQYDFGARQKTKWSTKHDNILWYTKNPKAYTFNLDQVDLIPKLAPGLPVSKNRKNPNLKMLTDCFSADTEVLTEDGWKFWSRVNHNDRLATVDPNLVLSFVQPVKLHAYEYSGLMKHIKTKTIDILCTPNHKLYVKPNSFGNYVFATPDDCTKWQHVALPNKLKWNMKENCEEYFILPNTNYRVKNSSRKIPPINLLDWCEFLGWYISEGCAFHYRDRWETHITQIKPEYKSSLEKLLNKMPFKWHYNGRSIVICNKQLSSYLMGLGKANNKHIPDQILKLSKPFLEKLYSSLMMGDGSMQRNCWVYHTTSVKLANQVHELVIKLGFNASTTVVKSKNPNWKNKFCINRRVAKESTFFPAKHIKNIYYSGMVYCATVEPYHTLVIRRNGKSSVVGNCWWNTIVPTNGKERLGYPTQKPLAILERIIKVHSKPGDHVLDFFAGCYDDQTEILTENGWKLFVDVEDNEKICSLSPLNNHIEYVSIVNRIVTNYNGPMISFLGRSCDLFVTPNHKMYCKEYKQKDYKFCRAENLNTFHYNIPISGTWTGQDIFVEDAYLKFLGFWYGDGYKSKKYRIGFNIAKHKSEFLLKQLEALSIRSKIYPHGNNAIKIHIHDKKLWETVNGNTFTKRIPRWIFKLSPEKIWEFVLGFAHADGHIRPNGRITLYGSNKALMDDLQQLIFHAGFSSTLSKHPTRQTKIKGRLVVGTQNPYSLSIHQKNKHIHLYQKNKHIHTYNGLVYCFTLEKNHIMYVRRNGKTAWCGNSGTTGEAAVKHGRKITLIDENPEAVAIMNKRFAKFKNEEE